MVLSVTVLAQPGAMEREVPHLPNVMVPVLLDGGEEKGQQAGCATVCVPLADSAQQEHALDLLCAMDRAQREGELFSEKHDNVRTLVIYSFLYFLFSLLVRAHN